MPAAVKRTDPLLAAIIADPDDDTVRLAYADHLEEEGEPERAEFVRVQVELARLPAWERRAKLLRFRERLLLVRHGEAWRVALPTLDGVTWGRFERGFVSEVSVENERVLMKRAGAIRAASPVTGVRLIGHGSAADKSVKPLPWLRTLRLVPGCSGGFGAATRLLETVTRLVCEGGPGDDSALSVAGAAQLTGLRELLFGAWAVSNHGAMVLARAKHLSTLRVLVLRLANATGYESDPHISEHGLRAIAESRYLTELTTLDVGNQRFTDAAVRAVLSSPTLSKLESVSFAGSPLTARAFDTDSRPMRLRSVELGGCVIGDAGADALARHPVFSKVCRLNLRACEIGPKGVAALARSPLARSVRELVLDENPLHSGGAEALTVGKWPELHTLSLESTDVGPESMKALQSATGIGPLLDLNLRGNDVGAAAAIAVSRAKWSRGLVRLNLARCKCAAGAVLGSAAQLRSLQQLDLTDNPLNPAGVEALMGGEWPELTDLNLSGTSAGDAGARALARSGVLGRLVSLSLARCGLTAEGFAALLVPKVERSLVQLSLARNTPGDEGAGLLLPASLPALRFLSIDGLGLSVESMRRLAGSPLVARLVKLWSEANLLTAPLVRTFFDVNRRPIPPDLEAAGFPVNHA